MAAAKSTVTPRSQAMSPNTADVRSDASALPIAIVHPICRHKVRHGLHGRAHQRQRHPSAAQKRHEHAEQVAHAIEQLLARTQARKGKANGQRRARQGKRRRQCQAHTAHADLGDRAGKAHDAHHARHKPDADGEHGGGGKHGKRTLALGDWAGIHTTHALGLVHAREHQPHRYDDRRDNRVRAKVEVRLERGGSAESTLTRSIWTSARFAALFGGLGNVAVGGSGSSAAAAPASEIQREASADESAAAMVPAP